MKPIFRRKVRSSLSGMSETFLPSTSMPPLSGRNNPAAIFSVSVFPVPVSPSKTTVSRSRTQKDTPRRICPSSQPMRTSSNAMADLASQEGKDPCPPIPAIIAAIRFCFRKERLRRNRPSASANGGDGRTILPFLKLKETLVKTISGWSKPQTLTRLATFLFCASCALSTLPVAEAQGFTVEQIMSSPFPESLTVAARVPRVAWAFDAKGVRNVWIADAPGFSARQVTHYSDDDGMALASLRLTPDGRTVVYSRGSELNTAGEVADPTSNVTRPNQQVWAADVEKGEPRLLGELDCTHEGCEDIELSPDGTMAVWAARGQLWVAPVSGAVPAYPLAFVRGENDSS